MDLGDKFGLGALIVAIIAVPIAAWVTRQYGTRRRKLLFQFEATSLVPAIKGYAADALKITYLNTPVDDPHLLTIRLENIGPSDVSSAHFDAGKPVQVRLNCAVYGVLSATHGQHTITPDQGDPDAVVELTPSLLKRRDVWVVEMLVSGSPNPQLVNSLVDTDVVTRTGVEQAATIAGGVIQHAGRGFLWPLLVEVAQVMVAKFAWRRRR